MPRILAQPREVVRKQLPVSVRHFFFRARDDCSDFVLTTNNHHDRNRSRNVSRNIGTAPSTMMDNLSLSILRLEALNQQQ